MKLIVGLGNPGTEFEKTRHNIGFIMVDRLADEQGWKWVHKARFKSDVTEGEVDGEKVVFAKPRTFMNTSGEALRAFIDFYHLKHHDVLVIHDDADIEWGKLRVVQKGNDGGHQGIKSLYAHGIDDTWRLKIGVSNEHRQPGQAIDFVLTRFKPEEWSQLDQLYKAVRPYITHYLGDTVETSTINWS
jgi:PTH1 family peptidyl-tRNA hydrolase